jgi:hypothetical protein
MAKVKQDKLQSFALMLLSNARKDDAGVHIPVNPVQLGEELGIAASAADKLLRDMAKANLLVMSQPRTLKYPQGDGYYPEFRIPTPSEREFLDTVGKDQQDARKAVAVLLSDVPGFTKSMIEVSTSGSTVTIPTAAILEWYRKTAVAK